MELTVIMRTQANFKTATTFVGATIANPICSKSFLDANPQANFSVETSSTILLTTSRASKKLAGSSKRSQKKKTISRIQPASFAFCFEKSCNNDSRR
jgi:hypothetical protein